MDTKDPQIEYYPPNDDEKKQQFNKRYVWTSSNSPRMGLGCGSIFLIILLIYLILASIGDRDTELMRTDLQNLQKTIQTQNELILSQNAAIERLEAKVDVLNQKIDAMGLNKTE